MFNFLSMQWLRDAGDGVLHAVPLDRLPSPADAPGPVALCGAVVLLGSLLDEPDGPRRRECGVYLRDR